MNSPARSPVADLPRAYPNAYQGFYAFAPHAGTAVMRAGMPLRFWFAFGELGLHCLQANVQPANDRSIVLLWATGWREEGYARRYLKIGARWRDHLMFAILAENVGATSRRATLGGRLGEARLARSERQPEDTWSPPSFTGRRPVVR